MSKAALSAAKVQYENAANTTVAPGSVGQVRATLAVAAALIAIAESLECK